MEGGIFHIKTQKLLVIAVLVLTLFIVAASVYVWWAERQIQQKTASQPAASPQPTRTAPTVAYVNESIITCAVKKEGNPLVQDVKKLSDGTIVGTFYGNINHITFQDDAKQSASIELISPKGEQIQTIQVKEEQGLVYDSTELKDLKLSDLKRGYTVVVSFNCFPQQDNLFKIAQIAVSGNKY